MLRHDKLRNTVVATSMGKVTLDEKGESNDLSVNHQKSLGKLRGFTFVDEEKEEAKKDILEEEVTKRQEEEDKKAEERKKEKEETRDEDTVEDTVEDPLANPQPKASRTKKTPKKKK